MRQEPDRYTRTAIALHWLIALAVVVQFAWGWWMQSIPKEPPGMRADAFNLHKSVGLTLFALMVLRVIWRIAHPPPPLPPMPLWRSRLAHFNHLLLYAALLAMPLAGYLGSVFSGYPVKYFGIPLPSSGVRDAGLKDLFSAIHYATSWVLASAVVLHLAGNAKHALIERDGLLARMGLRLHPRLKRGGNLRSTSVTLRH